MREMCSLDMKKVLEILNLSGSYIRKVFSEKDYLILRIYQKGIGEYDLTFRPGFVYPAKKVQHNQPSSFSMLLRKLLKNRKIERIDLLGFDRIVKIEIGNLELIVEVGRDFNVIVTENGIIRNVMHNLEVKDRSIRKGRQYEPPPKKHMDELWDEGKPLEAFLTLSGIAGPYAKYLSSKIGNVPTSNLDKEKVYAEINKLINSEPKFMVDEETYYLIDIGRGREADIWDYFQPIGQDKDEKKETKKVKKTVEWQIKNMKDKLEKLEEKISFLELHWEEAEEFLKTASPKKDGTVEFHGIKLSVLKPFREQMSEFYDKRKKLRKKIEKAEEVLKSGVITRKNEKKAEKTVNEKRRWYHRFRYFEFPGKVFVLGKDANTNEELIKKYSKMSPVVAHSVLPGSPFGIIIFESSNDISEEDYVNLAKFVACYSSAWKSGVGITESYWVFPEQVSKKAPSGEYLTKGSFMIYGKKNMVNSELRLAFGNLNKKLLVGPPPLVKLYTEKIVEITPGNMPAKDLSILIRNRIGKEISREDIERRIPYGFGDLA